MSWSDEKSKIVKNAKDVKKFEFRPLDLKQPRRAPDSGDVHGPEDGFTRMNDGGGELSPPLFHPMEESSEVPQKFESMGAFPDERSDSFPDERSDTEKDTLSEPELHAEAAALMEKTRQEMAQLEEETSRNCSQLEKEAYDEGFKRGEADGVAAGEQKALPLVDRMSALVEELRTFKSRLLVQHEQEIVKLVFAICQKITQCEIALDNRVIQEVVRQTLQRTSEKKELTLHLHPDDVTAIEALQAESEGTSKDLLGKVSLCADASVTPGGCLVETPHGEIDATLETRLNQVYESLEKAFEASDQELPPASDSI